MRPFYFTQTRMHLSLKKIKCHESALSYQLLGAAQAVSEVLGGKALPHALQQDDLISSATRGAIQDIAYRTMRSLGTTDALMTRLLNKPASSDFLYSLLACCLALLIKKEDGPLPYTPFTVVNQAVLAAASHQVLAPAQSLVNAVLRRFLREEDELLNQLNSDPVAQYNYPLWWIKALQSAYPSNWEAILLSGNKHPPLTLRVNTRQTTLFEYMKVLAHHQIEASVVGPYAIKLHHPIAVRHIPGFEKGWVSVQDAAAQLAIPLLNVQNGQRVLDACAAPGGKSGHLLEWANIHLFVLDSDPKRLLKVKENSERLQLFPEAYWVGDASCEDWWDKQLFDAILADVPCTASGILRRHPDIRWLRRASDTTQLATLSSHILDNLWKMVKPGGKLLFVTCSIWPEESDGQAEAFVRRHHDAEYIPTLGQLLPTDSEKEDHDGLFFALFHKRP